MVTIGTQRVRRVALPASLVAAAVLVTGGFTAQAQASSGFACTQIIGFSQTATWYGDQFLTAVQDPNWELLWNVDGSIDLWKDPQYGGWYNDIVGPCSSGATSPDRVVLTISNDFQSDPSVWANDISGAISAVRYHYPEVKQILLQTVVGGPSDQLCYSNSSVVRASYNDPYIDQGISMVLSNTNDPSVVRGYQPEVRTCDDFADDKGHLQDDAANAIGTLIGQYYASTQSGASNGQRATGSALGGRGALAPTLSVRPVRYTGRLTAPVRTANGVHNERRAKRP